MDTHKDTTSKGRFPWWFWTIASGMILVFIGALLWPSLLERLQANLEIEVDMSTADIHHEAPEDAPDSLLGKAVGILVDPKSVAGDLVLSVDAVIKNNNPIGMEITHLEYVIIANEKKLVAGVGKIDDGAMELPAKGEVTIRLENRTPVDSLLEALDMTVGALAEALRGKTLKISIEGNVHVHTWLGDFEHTFTMDGLEALSKIEKLPKILPGGDP